MICGVKSSRILLVLLLLSVLSSPLFSDDLPAWAEAMTEAEAKTALVESVTRLETTTNALEISNSLNSAWNEWSVRHSELLNNAMSLNAELIADKKADDERLTRIETLLNDYEADHRTELRRTRWSARLEGAGVGALIALIVTLFI